MYVPNVPHSCCPPLPAKSAVVGVDKTLNLGPLHATVTAYKNLSIKNRQTRDHPISIGPLFLLGLGNFELSEQFKKRVIPRDAFYGKTDKQRKAHMKKFFHEVAERDIVRAAKRSMKTARAPKHGGKKPCQRRRHHSERT